MFKNNLNFQIIIEAWEGRQIKSNFLSECRLNKLLINAPVAPRLRIEKCLFFLFAKNNHTNKTVN